MQPLLRLPDTYICPVETGFYYLKSRYYNPECGRFLNADGIIGANGDLISNNLFAYCSNNPVMFADPSGYCWLCGNPYYNAASMSSSAWERHLKICQNNYLYGTYKYCNEVKNVYITTDRKRAEKFDVHPRDVVIVDKRANNFNSENELDPNMILLNSYKIKDYDSMKQIAELMIAYDADNPTAVPWNRTVKSLVTEWDVHNIAYNCHFMRDHTQSTDFNTQDEGKGLWDFIVEKGSLLWKR